jgi:hypothetical protein
MPTITSARRPPIAPRLRQRVGRGQLDLDILQHDRLQRSTASDLYQRCKMIIGGTATKVNIRLDCRAAKMAIEDCLRSLEPDALVFAVQQLAQALDGARRKLP